MTQGIFPRPYVSQSPTLLTYRDIIDRLVDFSNAGVDASQLRDYRIAIDEAYRELAYGHDWKYYLGVFSLALSASYDTGTITYIQATRTLTLSGGTFPSWAVYGHIKIGPAFYDVERNPTNTTLILTVSNNPGEDVDAGTDYILYRSVYTLPADFVCMSRPRTPNSGWASAYIEPATWLTLERRVASGGFPTAWTVMADPRFFGSFAVYVWPYPTTANTYAFIYKRRPRDLKLSGNSVANSDYSTTATISASTNGTTVTGSGTTFTPSMVGSVLRFGDATNVPDGLPGLHPYQEQGIVQTYNAATSVALMSAPSFVYTSVKYNVSDPIDMSPSMVNALLALARYKYAMNRPDKRSLTDALYAEAHRALILAKENDDVVIGRQYESFYWDIMHDHTYDTLV